MTDMTPRDVFTSLTAIALSTKRITLGAGIASAYWRTPAVTASAISLIDELSVGRAKLALGTGMQNWTEQMGFDFRRPATTVKEHLQIVRQLLQGRKVTYTGQVYNYKDYKLEFAPVRAEIPILVGGMGPKLARLAGELADGLLLGAITHPRTIRETKEVLTKSAEVNGRGSHKMELGALMLTFVSEDGTEAKKLARQRLAQYVPAEHYQRLLPRMGFGKEATMIRLAFEQGDLEGATKFVSDAMVENLCVAGTPEECEQKISDRVSAGLTMPILYNDMSGRNSKARYEMVLKAFGG